MTDKLLAILRLPFVDNLVYTPRSSRRRKHALIGAEVVKVRIDGGELGLNSFIAQAHLGSFYQALSNRLLIENALFRHKETFSTNEIRGCAKQVDIVTVKFR